MGAPMGGTSGRYPLGHAGGFGASPSTNTVGGYGTTPSNVSPNDPRQSNVENNDDQDRILPRSKSSTTKNAGDPPPGQGHSEDYRGDGPHACLSFDFFKKMIAFLSCFHRQPQPQDPQPVPVKPVVNCSHSRGQNALHGASRGAFLGWLAGGRQGRRAGAAAGAVIGASSGNSNGSANTSSQSRPSQGSAGRHVVNGAMTGGFVGSLVGGRRTALTGAGVGATVAAGNHCSGPGGEAVRSAGHAASATGERIGQTEVGGQSISETTKETKARVGEAWRDGCKVISMGANNWSSRMKKSA